MMMLVKKLNKPSTTYLASLLLTFVVSTAGAKNIVCKEQVKENDLVGDFVLITSEARGKINMKMLNADIANKYIQSMTEGRGSVNNTEEGSQSKWHRSTARPVRIYMMKENEYIVEHEQGSNFLNFALHAYKPSDDISNEALGIYTKIFHERVTVPHASCAKRAIYLKGDGLLFNSEYTLYLQAYHGQYGVIKEGVLIRKQGKVKIVYDVSIQEQVFDANKKQE